MLDPNDGTVELRMLPDNMEPPAAWIWKICHDQDPPIASL
jgi:hypothetical protein